MNTVPQVKAPHGSKIVCKNWVIEAAYRMIQNNLDPDVAERPSELIVYGGNAKAARNWDCYFSIIESLKNLKPDETLLVQSGKPIGVMPTHEEAPRVLIANSNLVPNWATWEHFHDLDRKGLIMFGQMTAGSWIYIGTQGILQGTYETFAACGRKHFANTTTPLKGKIVVSAGLGGMGGAQPLASKLAGAAYLGIEIDPEGLRRRIATNYLDEEATSIEEAINRVQQYARENKARSVGFVANIGDVLKKFLDIGFIPDILTDQTSAHDPLNGYIPRGVTLSEANYMRVNKKDEYLTRVMDSIGEHVTMMLEFQKSGSVVFDYGNNIRAMAQRVGVSEAFKIPGFVPEFIRPMFCEGNGPFRWVALSGDPNDIAVTDKAILELFPENDNLRNWFFNGVPHVKFQGLPARICWLRHGEREKAGVLFNDLVKSGRVSAPIVIGRDHLDSGSVASPTRETENMLDGSDAISDWPILNALINAVNGASWVSFHHGGGVGMGYSQHAGMVIVADGTANAERRLRRVLNSDPTMGIMRHADAGYPAAIDWAKEHNVQIPMMHKK
ncbi:MAG: urocanate hydratase [Nitrospirae bacterium]|nr:urocanate hydratase [Nitrospirota bacterium]